MAASIVNIKWFRGVWVHCDIWIAVGIICPTNYSTILFSFDKQAYLIISFQKKKKKEHVDVSLNIVLTRITLCVNGSS